MMPLSPTRSPGHSGSPTGFEGIAERKTDEGDREGRGILARNAARRVRESEKEAAGADHRLSALIEENDRLKRVVREVSSEGGQ